MSVYITVLLEYETADESPRFGCGMVFLGGKLAAVQFSDLFAERDKLEVMLAAREGTP